MVFVHIKQALGLAAAQAGCASAVPVKMQSIALQKKVQTSPADTWLREQIIWPSRILRDPDEKPREFRCGQPTASTRHL